MRRLTLILSDLYLPVEVGRDATLPAALALPHLDALLRVADRMRCRDFRHWLCCDLGRTDLADLTPAALAALGQISSGVVWLATPVRLEARLDHVRMLERGLPRLGAAERDRWRAEFSRAFAPCELHDTGPRGFLLTGLQSAEIKTLDPARLLDTDIAQALPSGAAARELRRLGAEIEMWIYGSAINVERERARRPRISALWLWGGGMPARPIQPLPAQHASIRFHGDDPPLMGLSRACSGVLPTPAPDRLADLDSDSERIIVELSPVNGVAAHALPLLDTHWFEPARAALQAGALDSIDLLANDRWFSVTRRALRRFWRPRAPWLAQLGYRGLKPKA